MARILRHRRYQSLLEAYLGSPASFSIIKRKSKSRGNNLNGFVQISSNVSPELGVRLLYLLIHITAQGTLLLSHILLGSSVSRPIASSFLMLLGHEARLALGNVRCIVVVAGEAESGSRYSLK